jgi:uracil-DNA glycosylase family 4
LGTSNAENDSQVRTYLLWLKDRGIDHFFTPVTEDFNSDKELQHSDPDPLNNHESIQSLNALPDLEINQASVAKAFQSAHQQILTCKQCPRGMNAQFRCSPYTVLPESIPNESSEIRENSSLFHLDLKDVIKNQVELIIIIDRLRVKSEAFAPIYHLLKKMLHSINLTDESYRVLPLTMCENNSSELSLDEIDKCRDHTLRAIKLYRPKIVLTLGIIPTFQSLIPNGEIISKGLPPWNSVRGKLLHSPYLTQAFGSEAPPVIGTFHPADLLRFPNNKRLAWEDLKLLRRYLDAKNN